MQITLYTTAGCHLCDLAEAILVALPAHYHVEIIHTEIGDSDELVERYGIRIPVVKLPDNSEVDWPFEAQSIINTLNLSKW